MGNGGGFASELAGSRLENCTIAGNTATGGQGGGVYAGGSNYIHSCTVASNAAAGLGNGGGIYCSGSPRIQNTIVALNNSAGDVSGNFTGDHNLISIEPRLAPLADNGGPTLTMALYPDSPAINAGILVPGITTDQRGTPRPVGGAADIGAFEWNGDSFYTAFQLRDLGRAAGIYHVQVVGPPSQVFRLQTSSDIAIWNNVSTNTTDSLGLRRLENLQSQAGPAVFYRTVSP
jgi:hypothetical protein